MIGRDPEFESYEELLAEFRRDLNRNIRDTRIAFALAVLGAALAVVSLALRALGR